MIAWTPQRTPPVAFSGRLAFHMLRAVARHFQILMAGGLARGCEDSAPGLDQNRC